MDNWKEKLPPIGQLGPFIALIVFSTFFGAMTDRFFSGENFSLILQQVAVVGADDVVQLRVVEVGPQDGSDIVITKGLAAGDHVILVFVPSCGGCVPCMEGRPGLCEPAVPANAGGTLIDCATSATVE